jgi:B12-binding domain/radical SAM domain protein
LPDIDLVLLHAPSVYDFRERPSIYGPISDVIPSTPLFEMYPLGFVSIIGYLEQHGYHVRLINLAVKMLKHPKLDVEKLISNLEAEAFGLDLHWLAHAAGSLDIAELVKEHHPNRPIILGGLSASYFHEEIIEHFPQIDYVIRGDTTEKPLLDLIECIEEGGEPTKISNLTWRDKNSRKRINPLSFVPENIDDLWIDYSEIVKLVVRHVDLESTLPYENFMEYPFTALLTCKGCTYNCITCGGSCYAFKNYFGRDRTVFKTPERLVEEMAVVNDYFKAPLFLIGDLRQAGRRWAEKVLNLIKREGLDNTITLELFDAISKDYMRKIADSMESWTLEISPESHDDEVRGIMGKPYSTDQMEKTIVSALEMGCKKFDVYFMVGLYGQTSESVLGSVEYCRNLYEKNGRDGRIYTFIAPMAPFLDPGSLVFERPEKYGFTKLYRNLREHKQALYQPSWKLYLSYFNDWMSRDKIAETTYEALIRMNDLKADMGVTDPYNAKNIGKGLRMARDLMRRIDVIIASTKDVGERESKFQQLRWKMRDAMKSTGISKKELRMPGMAGIRIKGAIKYLLKKAGLIR